MIDFAVVEGKIRFGLNAVKNVGESACRAIVRAREEGGPFTSIWDFTERVDPQIVNKRALESLVKCGALDSTGSPRTGMLEVPRAGARLGAEAAVRQAARPGLDLRPRRRGGDDAATPPPSDDRRRRVREERAAAAREGDARPLRLRPSADADPRPAAPQDRLRAQRARAPPRRRDRHRRRHRRRAEADDDEEGRPDGLRRARGRHRRRSRSSRSTPCTRTRASCSCSDRVLIVKGRVDHKGTGETKLVAIEITAFEATPERKEVRLKVDARIAPAGRRARARRVVKDFPGEAPVYSTWSRRSGRSCSSSARTTVCSLCRTSSPR